VNGATSQRRYGRCGEEDDKPALQCARGRRPRNQHGEQQRFKRKDEIGDGDVWFFQPVPPSP